MFVMYANAFVQGPAEMLPLEDYYEKEAALERARKMYLRGTELLYSALDKRYPGFSAATLDTGTLQPLLKKCRKNDAGLLYWTVAGSLAALSIDIFDFDLGARLPELEAMMKRAYELDPDFGGASIDEVFILFYGSLPDYMGGDRNVAQKHFELAVAKTGGNSAGAYVSYAQTICVADQNYDAFKINLEKALAINVDVNPQSRLVNILNQRKARYLLETAYTKFPSVPIPENF
jgi:predicted anti-sigma-YlaC factor YlaD